MRMRTIEISVGAFLLAGILSLVFLAVRVSGINVGSTAEGYTVTARFNDVAGLTRRARVTMAGVTIGRVTEIGVDSEYGEAIVTMEIDGKVNNLAIDTSAKVVTEGVLGGKYISLVPGADEEYLAEGDEILDTQGSFVLENLIGEFVTRGGS